MSLLSILKINLDGNEVAIYYIPTLVNSFHINTYHLSECTLYSVHICI